MQNIVYERKQNGEYFFSLPAVTYSRFGNCPANGLVTEQPQYFVVICIFPTWQNTETMLISNGLRFIFTCSLSLAEPITFHVDRPTAYTKIYPGQFAVYFPEDGHAPGIGEGSIRKIIVKVQVEE